jgi:hypothetical protein
LQCARRKLTFSSDRSTAPGTPTLPPTSRFLPNSPSVSSPDDARRSAACPLRARSIGPRRRTTVAHGATRHADLRVLRPRPDADRPDVPPKQPFGAGDLASASVQFVRSSVPATHCLLPTTAVVPGPCPNPRRRGGRAGSARRPKVRRRALSPALRLAQRSGRPSKLGKSHAVTETPANVGQQRFPADQPFGCTPLSAAEAQSWK